MNFEIICPYCFRHMGDHEVLFRSEKVHTGECDILPEQYDDVQDFQANYQGPDKENLLRRYRDWTFFQAGPDPEYERFWQAFNGTTEYDLADAHLGVKAYHRRVIDPQDPAHQRYLRPQERGDFLIRDRQGMAVQIELTTGERCGRRVCRFCHNPLPANYGKTPVKFLTVIGIVGAGKTVYLSQLFKNMGRYAREAGLSAMVTGPSVLNFLEANPVAVGKPLPGATPEQRLQQPLFYELAQNAGGSRKRTETLVMYDVAGEVFRSEQLVARFAPFVEHADGVLLLIDPMQFEVVSSVRTDEPEREDPSRVLAVIHQIVSHGDTERKCATPFAVCISKADKMMDLFSDSLRGLLLRDLGGVQGPDGFAEPVFDAKSYNPVLKELTAFVRAHNMDLAHLLRTHYTHYAYFAFTALGCGVQERRRADGSLEYQPVGPVLPKRIEEPLLWLFHMLGYIPANERVGPVLCPLCGWESRELPEEERVHVLKKGFWGLGRVEEYRNRECLHPACRHRWYCSDAEGEALE